MTKAYTGNDTDRDRSLQTTPKAPPSFVQNRTGFSPKEPHTIGMEFQDNAPNGENDILGRRRHQHQQERRQGFCPENPIP
ncbi:hypothetical protein C2845_PM01G35560 [Panicum miliaceum]|uniref:Uncharacterized protein n=1 Tax=Panicum miliaceum TaxID=4540 RepID=A0A3L6TN43_PANMI|nr:hypothetical protein C2845_PM01G35560 [Panicum miliaceum]